MDTQEPQPDSDAIATYRRNLEARREKERAAHEAERERLLQAARAAFPAIAARFPSVAELYLHGSLVHPGAFHARSDIDVAMAGATAADYFALWAALEEALPERPVDLRDLEATPTFARRVRQKGILIYARSNPATPG